MQCESLEWSIPQSFVFVAISAHNRSLIVHLAPQKLARLARRVMRVVSWQLSRTCEAGRCREDWPSGGVVNRGSVSPKIFPQETQITQQTP